MVSKEPEGGKWTYDSENRKKYPKDKTPPNIQFPERSEYYEEAIKYTEKYFDNHYGELNDFINYPIDFESSSE